MSRVPLSDEETQVIFASETLDNLKSLDATKQELVLSRLADIASSESPPSQFVREQIKNIDIIAAGDQCRLYTKVVTHIPEGDTAYHLIFVLYIDDTHEYKQRDLVTYNTLAQDLLEAATSLDSVTDVEGYLEHHNALDVDALRSLLK